MTSSMKERFHRFKRAGEIIAASLASPSSLLLKEAEHSGCLFEFEMLCEEVRQWLDDDMYYDELAYEFEEGNAA